MKNQQIYKIDPSTRKLVNDGVARVTEDRNAETEAILRWELESFVCKGQYAIGMELILDRFLANLGEAEQPAAWISGFYGSGKSHLVKMLRALWVNHKFSDGATARDIATLPNVISDLYVELERQSKRYGGLHAASGTLKASGTESVSLALLAIVFKSAGLPIHYPKARFVMRLKQDGIYDEVRRLVEKTGANWEEELDNFYVAEDLYNVLTEVQPMVYSKANVASDILPRVFPTVKDVGTDDMIKAINSSIAVNDQMPLTLIVLDEVQQYIGQVSQRSLDVQEVVESCSKGLGSRLLFVGTGQTAITGTSHLKKLEGRFTVRVELSDADVDSVIREVILAKKPGALKDLESVLEKNAGEISRHLSGTSIDHRNSDRQDFAQDYPLLPVRRRFWENTLRILDRSGTESQVRNQLTMVHSAIKANMDKTLGHVIGADFLFFENSMKLLQTSVLPRKVYETTQKWIAGSEEERLMARACGIIFLINKLSAANSEIGIAPTVDTIADLLVEDLNAGSTKLRQDLPKMLDGCELLMKVDSNYLIQTEESAAWSDEFRAQRGQLEQDPHRIDAEREQNLHNLVNEYLRRNLVYSQGRSMEQRQIHITYGSSLPTDSKKKSYLWVRHGWDIDVHSVVAEAKAAGNDSATVFIFIPKLNVDGIRNAILDFKAANTTLQVRDTPHGAQAQEAYNAVETQKQTAERNIRELLTECIEGSRVFQAGGSELQESTLKNSIAEAAKNAIARLYDQFDVADQTGWDKVFTRAKGGAPDALSSVAYKADAEKHPVCKAILQTVGTGMKGRDLRDKFLASPYGWPKDAVDAVVVLLIQLGHIVAQLPNHKVVGIDGFERRDIGTLHLKQETAQVGAKQRIEIRTLMVSLGITVKSGEELASVPALINAIKEIAESAGGDAPKPEVPDLGFLALIRQATGNDQLIETHNQISSITKLVKTWRDQAKQIDARYPQWVVLNRLLDHATGLPGVDVISISAQQIYLDNLLIADPDQVTPLVKNVTQILRDKLNNVNAAMDAAYKVADDRLEKDQNWSQLNQREKDIALDANSLHPGERPKIDTGSTERVLELLETTTFSALQDRLVAIPTRVDALVQEVAKKMSPETQFVEIANRNLDTEVDVDQWLKDMDTELKAKIKNGPIIII